MIARGLVLGLAVVAMSAALHAQVTSKTERVPGESKSEVTTRVTGEVVSVQGNWLLARVEPGGRYTLFNVQPGRASRCTEAVNHEASARHGRERGRHRASLILGGEAMSRPGTRATVWPSRPRSSRSGSTTPRRCRASGRAAPRRRLPRPLRR